MVITRLLRILSMIVLSCTLLGKSSLPPADPLEQIRTFTRGKEFDYLTWSLEALMLKKRQAAIGTQTYLSDTQQRQIVFEYLALTDEINRSRSEIEYIFSDPEVEDPQQQAARLLDRLNAMQDLQEQLAPLSESILQQQVSATLAEMGLALGGQPIPPVLYHVTVMPRALIISPRSVIRQDANISLKADIRLEEIMALEHGVETGLDVSALVVPVGGVGIYPPLVMSTTHLPSLLNIIAHEWTHNHLTLRPLGMLYDYTPELRTINETAANIVGKEASLAALARYYPELLPPPEPPETVPLEPPPVEPEQPPLFDFRAEMYETRVTTDRLLEEGKIEEAEAYMEMRRRFLWENGYPIRRLNQAYFAFHGAYADLPGGAAGADPVGTAVRRLRQQSRSLAEFVNRIAWVTSFEALEQIVR